MLHSSLHAANPSQPISSFQKTFDSAIAEGKKLSDAGKFRAALPPFERAYRLAVQAGDFDRQAIALIWSGNCEMGIFQYREAVRSEEAAAPLALRANDRTRAGVAKGNAALVYYRLGDFALAEKMQGEAILLLQRTPTQGALAQAWFTKGSAQVYQGEFSEARRSYDTAIAIAQKANFPSTEAYAWDERGNALLLIGDIAEAEKSINRGYSIRQRIHDKDALPISLDRRAELELKKGEFQLALKDIDQVFATAGPLFRSFPPYYPIHVRGQILLGLGRKSEALSELHRAVEAATLWRQSAMPGDASSTQTVAYLHDVYQDYAELAAKLALERNDAELSRRAFEALAENRAASLREQLTLSLSRNSRLPPRYFELLSELQAAQSRVTLGENTAKDEANLQQIQLELSDLEDQIELKDANLPTLKEKNALQNSLRNIQFSLGKSDVLLSFCLGKKQSFLWTVTGEDVHLYSLPAENEIASQAKAFSDSIQYGRNSQAARTLSENLFGKLTPAVWQKRDWLITADGALLNGVPFSALPDLTSRDHSQPLIATHTIRALPSELLLLAADRKTASKRFVGVADPIYNLADARRVSNIKFIKTGDGTSSLALGRLIGSEREIKDAAKQSGMADVQLLTGSEATSAALENALRTPPEILHFAVHVVSPQGQPQEAALALSLTNGNMPELLTREAITAYRVPGSLVVLSGCSSDQGRALPSAGLIGLSRAWLLAGAAAVLVTAWPTADDSGQFFSVFYSHLQALKSGSLSARAAAALQQAQLQMLAKQGHRSSPSFWAAYSLVSKE